MFTDQFKPLDLNLYGVRLPEIVLTQEDYKNANTSETISNLDFLKQICKNGFEKKIKEGLIKEEDRQKYRDRFKTEIDVLIEGGFVDYILLVWDIINFTVKSNIPIGFGRGSGVGSLILYLTGITSIDPIVHELYFERFVSKARIKKTIIDGITYLDGSLLMDIDTDIAFSGRESVVNYLLNKYKGKSCKLSTYSTLTSKILIKECGKIVGEFSEQTMNEISSYIESIFGKVRKLEESYKENEHFRKFCDVNPKIYQIAQKLHGLIKAKSSHASGYIVSYHDLGDCIPVELGSHNETVSSYDMYDASDIAVKVDLLGLQDLELLHAVCKNLNIKPESIDINDPFIYKCLQDLKTPYGLFQICGSATFTATQKIRPSNFEQLMSILAISRPGSIAFVDKFAKYTNTGELESLDEHLDKIFYITGNVPLFQESLMKCAHETFGLSLEDAEGIRRACGKKIKEDMMKYEGMIYSQAEKLGLPKETAEKFWSMLISSADYSFNRSHSCAYSALTAISVFLKNKYPLDFFLESLKMAREKQDVSAEINLIQSELQYFNIKLLPPDLVKSQLDFTKEGNNLRFGLSAIKGISDKTVEALKSFLNSEKSNKFEVFQAAKKSGMSIGVLSALIQAGCLQSLDTNRVAATYAAQLFNLLTDREKSWCLTYGYKYNYSIFDILNDSDKIIDDKGKILFKPSRLETIKKKAEPYRDIFKMNNRFPQMADYFFERRLLGFSYSQKLKDIYDKYSSHTLNQLISLDFLMENDIANIVGEVIEIQEKISKKNKKYCRIVVSDESATKEVLLFEPRFSEFKNDNLIPQEGNIVILTVKKWGDTNTVQNLKLSTDKIYHRLMELKD